MDQIWNCLFKTKIILFPWSINKILWCISRIWMHISMTIFQTSFENGIRFVKLWIKYLITLFSILVPKGLVLLCSKCTRHWNSKVFFFGKWLKCKREGFDWCVFLEILLSQTGLLFLELSSVGGSVVATFVFLSVFVCFCMPVGLPVSLPVSVAVCLSVTSFSQEPLIFIKKICVYFYGSVIVKYW